MQDELQVCWFFLTQFSHAVLAVLRRFGQCLMKHVWQVVLGWSGDGDGGVGAGGLGGVGVGGVGGVGAGGVGAGPGVGGLGEEPEMPRHFTISE